MYFVGLVFILRKPKIKIVSEYKPVYQKLCDLSKTCTPKYLPPKKAKAKKAATEIKYAYLNVFQLNEKVR